MLLPIHARCRTCSLSAAVSGLLGRLDPEFSWGGGAPSSAARAIALSERPSARLRASAASAGVNRTSKRSVRRARVGRVRGSGFGRGGAGGDVVAPRPVSSPDKILFLSGRAILADGKFWAGCSVGCTALDGKKGRGRKMIFGCRRGARVWGMPAEFGLGGRLCCPAAHW